MKRLAAALVVIASASLVRGDLIVSQLPAPGGGTMRTSKLWVDPLGENDLDGDAICYADFVLSGDATISHIEWWGDVDTSHGFQIEVWKQDPGTIAYQPWGVFRETVATPEWWQITHAYTVTPDPTGTTHYSLDLSTPISLAANNAANPRWFLTVIGLTEVPYLEWKWAQGLGGSNRTFQWVRGGYGGGDIYRVLGDGRAMVLGGTVVPEPATLVGFAIAASALLIRRRGDSRR